ncbi:MAG: futalosine hydrolase [Phycisphaerales bacterium]|nr:MAG: futalosine hydrolase [Phycisphaerales bacterium]
MPEPPEPAPKPPTDATCGPAVKPWLLVLASELEARAVLEGLGINEGIPESWRPMPIEPGLRLLVTGVGKANAAAASAMALSNGPAGAVLSLGIAGILPTARPPELGQVVVATRSAYADEGLALPDGGFVGCHAMGFPLGDFDDLGVPGDPLLLHGLGKLSDRSAPIATVSTCSGTDALARAVADRTGALAEAMEGAAVGQVAVRLGVPFAEVRVMSNTTGDRAGQRWAMAQALGRLGELARGIVELARSAAAGS